MNESYYKLGLKELESIKEPKRLLLHSCCAPCSSHVISYLTKYFDITILYYNPNISPKKEYDKRKKEQIRLIKEIEKTNKIDIIAITIMIYMNHLSKDMKVVLKEEIDVLYVLI